MKLYRIQVQAGEPYYFDGNQKEAVKIASGKFAKALLDDRSAQVTVESGEVEVSAKTVLALLNGGGGYWKPGKVILELDAQDDLATEGAPQGEGS